MTPTHQTLSSTFAELLEAYEMQAHMLRDLMGKKGGWSKSPDTLSNRAHALLHENVPDAQLVHLSILRALANVEQELEDSAPIDRLRLLAMVRQAMVDLASLEMPAHER